MRLNFALLLLLSALVGCGGGNKGASASKGGVPISSKPQGKVAKGAFSSFAGMVEVHNLLAIIFSDADHPCVKKSDTRWVWSCRSDQKRLKMGRQGSIEANVHPLGVSVLRSNSTTSNSLWRRNGRAVELADQNFNFVITQESSDLKYRFEYTGVIKFQSEPRKGKPIYTERTWSIQGLIVPADSSWSRAQLTDMMIDYEELVRDDKGRQVSLSWNQMASTSDILLDQCGRPEGEFSLKDSEGLAQVVASLEQGMGSGSGGTRTRWADCTKDMTSYALPYLW